MQSEMKQAELSLFERIGGTDNIRRLAKYFYRIMDVLPETYGLRKMHAANLQESEDKLYKFLNGWMDGPDLYEQEYGHPMLLRRHMSFQVDIAARDQWLLCMDMALKEIVEDAQLRVELSDAFARVGDHLRNQPN